MYTILVEFPSLPEQRCRELITGLSSLLGTTEHVYSSSTSSFASFNNGNATISNIGNKNLLLITSNEPSIQKICSYLSFKMQIPAELITTKLLTHGAKPAECQEPHCRVAVAKTWYGRQVCADHYEQYQDSHLGNIDSMNEY